MSSLSWAEACRRGLRAPVVSRDGEQDIATVAVLTEALTDVSALDDADIVVDLSDASFADAATLGAFVSARTVLQEQSRTLTVRAPSIFTRRVLDICGLADLVDPISVDDHLEQHRHQ